MALSRSASVSQGASKTWIPPEIARLKFWAPPAALTYRRTIVEKIGGWKEWLPIIQDARFLQDAGLVGGRFVHVPGIGARYRVHLGTSLSRRGHAAFVSDVFRNGCDLQAALELKGEVSSDMRGAFAELYGYTARTLFFHDRAAFRDCVARLYKVEPGFRLTWPKVASLASTTFGFESGGRVAFAFNQIAPHPQTGSIPPILTCGHLSCRLWPGRKRLENLS